MAKTTATGSSVEWSAIQVYVMASLCLLLGVATGYLVRGSAISNVRFAKVAMASAQRNLRVGASSDMPVTAEQFKHGADSKAEPLLAELQKRPNDARLLTRIGEIYFYGHQFSLAAEYYERAAKVNPDAPILTSLGAIYHYAGNDKKAIASLNRALRIDPQFDGALVNLGMLQWQSLSDPKAAITTWKKFLKAHPNHPKRAQVEALIAQAKTQRNVASLNADRHTR